MKIVVFIDDDLDDLDLLTLAVAELDASTICYAYDDPERAMADLSARKFLPDAIFLDINMPKMTGDVCLKFIRQNLRMNDVTIAVISTSMASPTRDRLLNEGANFALWKPYRYQEYGELVRLVLGPA